MTIVDDPMLALIVRFVINKEQHDRVDEEFIQRQIDALQAYLDRYPRDQRERRALEWVQEHAANYRRQWQRQVIPRQAEERRCPDCPLGSAPPGHYCSIHKAWLKLLKEYLADDIDSTHYIQQALDLLRQNKAELKISMLRTDKRDNRCS